jgi:hypothetical protein
MRVITPLATFVAAALAVTACTSGAEDTPSDSDGDAGADSGRQATPAECITTPESTDTLATGSAAGDVLALTGEIFSCAGSVVLADENAFDTAAGAQLAAALDSPLLLPHADLASELQRLAPDQIHAIGAVDVPKLDPAVDVRHLTSDEATQQAADVLGTSEQVSPAGGTPDTASLIDTVAALNSGDRVVRPAIDDAAATPSTDDATANPEPAPVAFDVDVPEVISTGLASPDEAAAVWLVDASDPAAILPIATLARAANAAIIAIDRDDLLGYSEVSERLDDYAGTPTRVIGTLPDDADWELGLLTNGHQLPGGGYEMFTDDTPHRFVAYYGHPDSTGMGVLGQQSSAAATYDAMGSLLEEYDTGDATVVPTFNVIATVAHNGGSTGRPDDLFEANRPYYVDYSVMHPPERFAEYVEMADEVDGYVVLDFQPGRNSFLYQVQQYEELLRHPRVGVALDPEWRLGSGQTHLSQIGTASAEEINETIDWLADLVREEGLPQKLVLIQQFKTSMISDREDLTDREEIALVIQMDGEGQTALSQKDDSYQAIKAGAEDAHWNWGWKNFVERDTPRPNTPEETLSKDPQPVYISYQ